MTSDTDEFEDLHGNPDKEAEQVAEPREQAEFAEEHEHDAHEQEDEFDDAEYGKRVQKRISKEVSKRKALETTLSQQQAYIQQLQQRLQGIEQRFSHEDEQKQQSEASKKLEELKAARRKAYEEGDLDAYDKLDDEYLEAKAEAIVSKSRPQQAPQQARQAQPVQQDIPSPMKSWMAEHAGWFNAAPEHAAKVRAANALFDTLTSEGFDENDPQTYAELNKRLSAAGVIAKRARDPMGAAPQQRYAGGPSSSREFSNEDARIMRKYGLDPNDPKVRASYMRDKDGSSQL